MTKLHPSPGLLGLPHRWVTLPPGQFSCDPSALSWLVMTCVLALLLVFLAHVPTQTHTACSQWCGDGAQWGHCAAGHSCQLLACPCCALHRPHCESQVQHWAAQTRLDSHQRVPIFSSCRGAENMTMSIKDRGRNIFCRDVHHPLLICTSCALLYMTYSIHTCITNSAHT